MELFDASGHLTPEGLQAALQERLDELQRLEVSEHLSFCDTCLLEYTAMLTDDTLLAPPEPLTPRVMQRVRSKARVLFFNRYVMAGVAAVFALVFWGTGVFTDLMLAYPIESIEQSSIADFSNNAVEQINEALNNFVQKFNRPPQRISAPSKANFSEADAASQPKQQE